MPNYPQLSRLMAEAEHLGGDLESRVVPYLVDVWLGDYGRWGGAADIVETTASGFSYLFDIAPGRLIAAWGISAGKNSAPRPKSRMRGHPLGAGPRYHRGHAIPHTLGGATDINLVPQLGRVNVGAFRALERRAVATPGSLYFTYWSYGGPATQTPTWVEQGLLVPGRQPDIRTHAN